MDHHGSAENLHIPADGSYHQTFQKIIRLVRDLAQKSGKQVELIMSREETEIVRNMVDTLYDSLVHMIRNCVDHGIEPPEKRRESGKSEMRRIFLRASFLWMPH